MGLFDRFFNTTEPDQGPTDVRFGRYSDAYKESIQYDLWDQSLALFDQKKYIQSYISFLKYLNDDDEQNVTYNIKEEVLEFEVIQGSKKLVGLLNKGQLRVEVKVAKVRAFDEALLEHILKYNYGLRYCRFGLTEDNHLSIIFDTTTLDGSPYKLYYAFKEAANHADKQDDLLIYEYDCVEHTDTDLFYPISNKRKDVKYDYLFGQINGYLEYIEAIPEYIKVHSGGIVYMLLSLAYKLDYLIKPEGFIMDKLEVINAIYFSNEIASTEEKIKQIIDLYKTILDQDESRLKSEMYRVSSTFGITQPVTHDRIVNFIQGELSNMDWYYDNDLERIAECIPEYIIGYALFHFAPPQPDLELLQLYMRIVESFYFEMLGFSKEYLLVNAKFDRKAIKSAIAHVIDRNKDKYPFLEANLSKLKFRNRAAFAQSYLQMIQHLDMTRKEV